MNPWYYGEMLLDAIIIFSLLLLILLSVGYAGFQIAAIRKERKP